MRLVTFSKIARLGGDSSAASPGPDLLGAAGLGLGAFEDVHHGSRRLGAILCEGRRAGAVVDLNRALAESAGDEEPAAAQLGLSVEQFRSRLRRCRPARPAEPS